MDTTLGPVEFVFWALFFTFAFGFFLGYVPHIAVCIMTFSESENYRNMATVALTFNAITATALAVVIQINDDWKYLLVFEYIEVCVTTLLIISSLIRIRVFFEKPWHWVIALIVVNIVDLYFVLYDYGINMLCQ